MNENNEKRIIDLGKITQTLWANKKFFFIVLPLIFILSCVWILPQPRYYNCSVSLAPESMGENAAGSLSSIASSFGINIGNGGTDAIYPTLYPDLFESNDFVVSLYNINVKTSDGKVKTDYYTYLTKHQKENWLTQPFYKLKKSISRNFSNDTEAKTKKATEINSFRMSKFDYELTEYVKSKIKCSVDKKTEVITISVEDQDPLVCATLADSIRERLQTFITKYRTRKARIDVEHYQTLADSANLEYRSAVNEYAQFCDANQDIILQSQQSKRDELENEMQMRYNTYQAMCTQLEAMKVRLQERTPVFTSLKSATVPLKPAGPKRMVFIIVMQILGFIFTSLWLCKNIIKK